MNKSFDIKPGLYGVLVLALAASFGAEAQAPSPWQQECIDAWDDADASEYCEASVDRIGASTSGQTNNCRLRNGSCSISAIYGDDDETTTWTHSFGTRYYSREDTEDLDLCFVPLSQDSLGWAAGARYTVTMRVGCNSGETTSADATSDGLQSLDTDNDPAD